MLCDTPPPFHNANLSILCVWLTCAFRLEMGAVCRHCCCSGGLCSGDDRCSSVPSVVACGAFSMQGVIT
jgi:hypothetical protein